MLPGSEGLLSVWVAMMCVFVSFIYNNVVMLQNRHDMLIETKKDAKKLLKYLHGKNIHCNFASQLSKTSMLNSKRT